MIKVCLKNHNLEYEIKEIINLFFSDDIIFTDEIAACNENVFILSQINECDDELIVYSKVVFNGISSEEVLKNRIPDLPLLRKKVIKRTVKLGLLKVLSKVTGKFISWGTLTGVRPTKVVRELMNNGLGDDEIIKNLQEYYGVSEAKALLMIEVTKNEKTIIEQNAPDSVSIYVGIPFCPDRCLYCSFTSNLIKKYGQMIGSFLEAIKKEIVAVEKMIKENCWQVETLYIGGGTPTSLNHKDFVILLQQLDNSLNLRNIKEITVEAGRPDTIDYQKINIMREYGVNRISINPQTMNAETLRLIGRNHTVEDIEATFEIARAGGFDNINMDIIVGLPGENELMVLNTLNKIHSLYPESLTIHTLAFKKGSKLIQEKDKYLLPDESVVESMIELCRKKASEMGMIPYYLYRQKNMVGHQENIGYCVPGKECIYNIKMIEEIQNIIAIGPGGVTRVLNQDTGHIEKVFNDKSVEGYISRIDEMIERKLNVLMNFKKMDKIGLMN